MTLTVGIFALLTLAKCDPGPYYNHESLLLERAGPIPEGLSKELAAVYDALFLEGNKHGFELGSTRFFRVSRDDSDPAAQKRLKRDERLRKSRGCSRIPIYWVPLWPGSFRAEPAIGQEADFVPATLTIASDRRSADLELTTEEGPAAIHYTVGGTVRAAGCATTPELGRRGPALGLLLVTGLVLRRRGRLAAKEVGNR